MLVISKYALPRFGEEDIQALLSGCTLRLFQNNKVPDVDDVEGDYTESTFTGYAAEVTPFWPTPALGPDDTVSMTHPTITFPCTGGAAQDVYGYYLTDATTGLILAERYSGAPFAISAGLAFAVQLYFSLILQP